MGRTPGATNKTPRELEAEAMRLLEMAKHKRKLAELRKENEELKKKRATPK